MITDYPNQDDILVIVRKDRDELKKLALELLKELMYLDGYSPDRHGNSIDQNAKLIQRAEKILDEK